MSAPKFNFYPNKALFDGIQGGKHLKEQFAETTATRAMFNHRQGEFAKELRMSGATDKVLANQAALLPDDAWREVDEVTMRVLREDEGKVYMNDLMPMARAVDIGKTAHLYRTSTDIADQTIVSMSGQEPSLIDKVQYDFNGHPVPIFHRSYGLNWREWRGMQSEGFDGISDDQEAAVAGLEQRKAQYILDGDTEINVGGYIGYGIRNHPETNVMDLDSSGFNIDLSAEATTSDQLETFFTRDFQQVLHDNLVDTPSNIYASKAIERRWSRSYSGAGGFKGGSFYDFLMSQPFINSVNYTYELTGNEFFSFPAAPKYIRPLVGMATTTIAIPRVQSTDNYNFKVMAAMGLEIRADANSRCGVISARAVA